MKILVDTHILLWALLDDPKLPPQAAKLIKDVQNDVLVSAVSLWEIAIKQTLGRFNFSQGELIEAISKSRFRQLPVTFEHCQKLADLPLLHRDPFDRMLVAQSLAEPAVLLTHDHLLKNYGSTILLV